MPKHSQKVAEAKHQAFLAQQPQGAVVTKTIDFSRSNFTEAMKRIEKFERASDRKVFMVR